MSETANCPLETGLRPCMCDLPRCPLCSYSDHDERFAMNHSACKGQIPDALECDRCDGVGWHEGGVTLKTACGKCAGRGWVEVCEVVSNQREHVLHVRRISPDEGVAKRVLIGRGNDIHAATCSCDQWAMPVALPADIEEQHAIHVGEATS